MTYADVPARAEVLGRVLDLAPVLRAHRSPTEETVTALADAGVFRLRVPARYGGYGCDTRTLVGVATELGRASCAAAWTAYAYWTPTWLVGAFGDQAQDEVYSARDVRVCGTLAALSTATPVDGGVVVSGRWPAVAGARYAQWQVVLTVVVPPVGDPFPAVALLPQADLGRGGYLGTVADEVFVPAHRVVELSTVAGGGPVLRAVAAASSVGAVVGIVQDARDWFFEGLVTDHGRTFAGGQGGFLPAMSHVQTADALAMIAEAERHAHRLATLVDTTMPATWSEADSARARADLTEVCRQAGDAVHILAATRGSAQIRLALRDVATTTHRVLTAFETGA